MPGFDRTGPMGAGPMTGWARGRCNPAAAADYQRAEGAFYGRGRGFGAGRGRRCGFGPGRGTGRFHGRAFGWQADERASLKAEADYLKESLDAVSARIAELEQSAD